MRSIGSSSEDLSAGQQSCPDRLNFPNHLLEEIGVQGEAFLTPGQDTIELWSVEKYEEQVLGVDAETYEGLAEDVLGDINLWDDNSAE